jgi:hypothetical protein
VNVRARSRSGRAFQRGLRGVMRCTVDRRIGSSEEPYTHYTEPPDTYNPNRRVPVTPHPHLSLDAWYPLRAFRHALSLSVRSYSVCTGIDNPEELYTHWIGHLNWCALHRPVRGSPYPQASLLVRFPFLPPPWVTVLRGQISGRYTMQSLEESVSERVRRLDLLKA